MPRDLMREKVAKIKEELKQVERELGSIRNRGEELRSLDEAERQMRERIETTEVNLDDMTPEKRRGLYQDLKLRVDVGEDGHPYISGVFPTRIAGITGTLLRTPEQRGHLYGHRREFSKADASSSRVTYIISGR